VTLTDSDDVILQAALSNITLNSEVDSRTVDAQILRWNNAADWQAINSTQEGNVWDVVIASDVTYAYNNAAPLLSMLELILTGSPDVVVILVHEQRLWLTDFGDEDFNEEGTVTRFQYFLRLALQRGFVVTPLDTTGLTTPLQHEERRQFDLVKITRPSTAHT
jgi:predicted nicotinamide N-methyase